MATSYPSLKLGELVSFKTGKLDSNAATPDGAYPFFTCSQETLRTDTFSFDAECVLLAGNNAAGVYPLKYFQGKFDAYQRTYVLRSLSEGRLLNRYLYYTLRLQLEVLKTLSTGVVTKFLTLSILKNLVLPVPPVDAQQRIVTVLSAYDDLIENNTRRIQILEKMAQAIYREWFVNFRFPGHEKVRLVDSPMGRIPQGWETSLLGDHLIALETGRRPKGGVGKEQNGVPSIGAENIKGIGRHGFDSEKHVSREFFEQMQRGVVKDRDVGLYKDGAYIGRSSYFRDGFPHTECCVNEHVFLLRSSGRRLTQNMLYLWLQEPDTVHAIRGTNANAAQPGINQQSVNGLGLVTPPLEVAAAFDVAVEPLLAGTVNCAKRNRVLRRTRDLLLPKLISGALDVSVLAAESP